MNNTNVAALRTVPHVATFHFKSWLADSPNGEALLKAVDAGKLAEGQLTTETTEKGVVLKRKSHSVNMQVPVLETTGLTEAEQAYLQALVVRELEAKQKLLVDAYDDKVLSFHDVFSQPFTVKSASIKVSAEDNKSAVEVLAEVLAAITSEKGAATIKAMAEKRFSVAACAGIKDIAVIERINGLVVEAFQVLQDSDAELANLHTPAFTAWLDALKAALAPKEEVSLDMF